MRKEFIKIYKIQKGDTLNSIAKKFNTNPTAILIENNISPKSIREGKILIFSK